MSELLELSKILGVRVTCTACGNPETYLFPLGQPEKICIDHMCSRVNRPVKDDTWRRQVAGIAGAIDGVRASEETKFKLEFVLSDKP